MSWRVWFTAEGSAFYPSRVELPFVEAFDPGEIVRGQAASHGHARLEAPDGSNGRESLQALCRFASQSMPALQAAGAIEFSLWVIRAYETQCNEEFTPSELALVATLNCPLCYSAYQESENDA